MELQQDIFISHASADKERYIRPLTSALVERKLTFWLDTVEITWGDSITLKINEGLRTTRYVLLCLSQNFLRRPWPENEFGSTLALQNSDGRKRVLPLILNAKERVLQHYPLLASAAYREFSAGPISLADELATLLRPTADTQQRIRVTVETVHSGQLCHLHITSRESVRWLIDKACSGLGLTESADTGAYTPFRVRWVLVDTQAEQDWGDLPRRRQQCVYALIRSSEELFMSLDEDDRLSEIGVQDGMLFHLYAIEDIDFPPPAACVW